MEPPKKGYNNPFARSDRLHFPAMTRAMWECPFDDSFGTPEVAGQLPCEGAAVPLGTPPPGWTPSSRDLSRFTPQGAADGRNVDAFFLERERGGLITPARSSDDFMRRGSLFDPFSQSGSSSRSRVSEAGLTPSSASEFCATSGPRSGGTVGQDGRSPAVRAVRFSPDLVTSLSRPSSSSKRRAMEGQTRISFSPVIEERSFRADSNWSISPVESPEPMQSRALQEAEICQSTGTVAAPSSTTSSSSFPPPPIGTVASVSMQHGAASAGAGRENDSLSVSSFSFGKDDACMHGGKLSTPTAAASSTESVARQLDFGTPFRRQVSAFPFGLPLSDLRDPTTGACAQDQAPSSPSTGSAMAVQSGEPTMVVQPRGQAPSSLSGATAGLQHSSPVVRGPPSSPAYVCASGSDWEPADWDSSLSREVMPLTRHTGSSCALPSASAIVEVRRRRGSTSAFGGTNTSVNHSSPMVLRELSPLRSEGGFSSPAIASQETSLSQSVAIQAGTECRCCGSMRRSSSTPIEASALADGRPVPIAIERLDGIAEDGSILLQLRLGTRRNDCQALQSSSGGPSFTSRSRSRSRKNSPASPDKGVSRSFSAPHFSAEVPLDPCKACGVLVQGQPACAFQHKYLAGLEPSLEELHYTVHALRQRFLERYFQAKPLRHSPGPARPLARAFSDSQLLRRRRRHAGSSGPRHRSSRARMGSRARGRSG